MSFLVALWSWVGSLFRTPAPHDISSVDLALALKAAGYRPTFTGYGAPRAPVVKVKPRRKRKSAPRSVVALKAVGA